MCNLHLTLGMGPAPQSPEGRTASTNYPENTVVERGREESAAARTKLNGQTHTHTQGTTLTHLLHFLTKERAGG